MVGNFLSNPVKSSKGGLCSIKFIKCTNYFCKSLFITKDLNISNVNITNIIKPQSFSKARNTIILQVMTTNIPNVIGQCPININTPQTSEIDGNKLTEKQKTI